MRPSACDAPKCSFASPDLSTPDPNGSLWAREKWRSADRERPSPVIDARRGLLDAKILTVSNWNNFRGIGPCTRVPSEYPFKPLPYRSSFRSFFPSRSSPSPSARSSRLPATRSRTACWANLNSRPARSISWAHRRSTSRTESPSTAQGTSTPPIQTTTAFSDGTMRPGSPTAPPPTSRSARTISSLRPATRARASRARARYANPTGSQRTRLETCTWPTPPTIAC